MDIGLVKLLDADVLAAYMEPSATQVTRLIVLQAQALRNQQRIIKYFEASELAGQFTATPKPQSKKTKKEK